MSEQLRKAILLELERWYMDEPAKIRDDRELMEALGVDDLREIERNLEILALGFT